MIYMGKSYQENIALDEHKPYAKLVDQLIDTGKIDDRYMTFISTQDIVNVIYLYVLKVNDILIYYNGCLNYNKFHLPGEMKSKTKENEYYNSIYEGYIDGKYDDAIMACNYTVRHDGEIYDHSPITKKAAYRFEIDLPKFNGLHINDMANLYNTLTQEVKEHMLFNIGLEKVLNIKLDDLEPVDKAIRSISRKSKTAQQASSAAAIASNTAKP